MVDREKKEICVLLLGDITYDSRVQKEIATLSDKGLNVDLYCLAGSLKPRDGDTTDRGRVNVFPVIKYFSRYFRNELTETESLLRRRYGDRLTIDLYRNKKLSTSTTLSSSALFLVRELAKTVWNRVARRGEASIFRFDDLRQVSKLCLSMISHGFARGRFEWLLRLRLYDVSLCICYWKQFIEQAGMAKYHFYHANDLYTLFPAYRLAKKSGGKLIYDAHEIMTVKAKTRNVLFWKAVERYLIKKCHSVITTTEMRAEHLRKRYKLRDVAIVKNCPVYCSHPKTNLLHERLELPHHKKIVLYLGGIQEGRGLANLIRSMHNVESDALAVLMGSRKRYADVLDQLVRSEGLDDRVYLTGPVEPEDIVRYASSADVGVQLLQNTNFNCYSSLSTKLFQYMMAGIPVVCSDLPGMRKIVRENDIGKVVNPEDIASISSALTVLFGDDSLRERYGRNAKEASTKYTWEHEAVKLLSVYGLTQTSQGLSKRLRSDGSDQDS